MKIYDDKTQLAEAAAARAIAVLKASIGEYGHATWALAGGSTPLLAYKIIAAKYADAIDWEKVTVIIGDERIGPLDGPNNNWHTIDEIIGHLPTTKIRPNSNLSAEEAAEDYSRQLSRLPVIDNGLLRFDLLWLGVGDDGHTLSLFPRHNSLLPSGDLVIAVHDSPKPPNDRISLSLRALQGTQVAVILAAGSDKKEAITRAQNGESLPIALAVSIIETHDGNITWLLDRDAAPTD